MNRSALRHGGKLRLQSLGNKVHIGISTRRREMTIENESSKDSLSLMTKALHLPSSRAWDNPPPQLDKSPSENMSTPITPPRFVDRPFAFLDRLFRFSF
jgi:hypothetical protein